MSNVIDSIRLSGVTYQIQGEGGTPTVELTQAQYDALVTAGTVSDDTYYIITDATPIDITNYYTKTETSGATQIQTALNGKQDQLVSGTNIKTINNESILGSGNIDIQGGGVNVVQTTGTSTTDVMSQDAVTTQLNGKGDAISLDMVGSPKKKVTFLMKSGGINGTTISSRDLTLGRGLVYGEEGFTTLSTSGLVETSAITTSISSSSTDTQVPSAKAVYDAIQEGGGGSITIDPNLDSGSTNPVANSAITEAVLVPSYRGLIEVQDNIAFPNATALYVENVTSGSYQDMTVIQFYLSGVSEVSESVTVTSFTGHTFDTEPSYMDYEWTEDNSIIFTPKTSGNYFYKIHNGWDTGFGVYIIDNYSSGSSSSVIQNEIYPKLNNLTEKVYSFNDTKVTGTSYNNLYYDYGGYWYHEIEILDNASGSFTASDKLRYDDFGYDDNDRIIFVKKTSGITSGSTDCLTSGGAYEALGGLSLVKLTQAEYDSLATKDNNTLYVIVN